MGLRLHSGVAGRVRALRDMPAQARSAAKAALGRDGAAATRTCSSQRCTGVHGSFQKRVSLTSCVYCKCAQAVCGRTSNTRLSLSMSMERNASQSAWSSIVTASLSAVTWRVSPNGTGLNRPSMARAVKCPAMSLSSMSLSHRVRFARPRFSIASICRPQTPGK